MTKKQLETIVKNLLAAGYYVQDADPGIIGTYDIFSIITNKTSISLSDVRVLAAGLPLSTGSIQYYYDDGEPETLLDISSLRNDPDLMDIDFNGDFPSFVIFDVKLNDQYSLAFFMLEGEMIPTDNGDWVMIDHSNKILSTDYIEFHDHSVQEQPDTDSWRVIYGTISRFLIMTEIIDLVNKYIPGYII